MACSKETNILTLAPLARPYLHGTQEHGGDLLYQLPAHFGEDWLNEYESVQASDHRFVYIGPRNTFTPLHRDTLCSYSWSSNIMGSKRWWMMPPEAEEMLHDADSKQVFDIRDIDHDRLAFLAQHALNLPSRSLTFATSITAGFPEIRISYTQSASR